MVFRSLVRSFSHRLVLKRTGSTPGESADADADADADVDGERPGLHLKSGATGLSSAAAADSSVSACENLLHFGTHTPASIDITAQDYLSIPRRRGVESELVDESATSSRAVSSRGSLSSERELRGLDLPRADQLHERSLDRERQLINTAKDRIYVEDVEVSSALTTRASSLGEVQSSPPREIQSEQQLASALPISDAPPSPPLHADLAATLPEDEHIIMQRKIWVKRPGASATLVTVNDDDLVDTVRDGILQKYANSLGRSVDSPDINLKIVPREQNNKQAPTERILQPDEHIARTLDSYYPGGQTIDDALVIDLPQRRTPRPSPRVGNHHHPSIPYPYFLDESRPGDGAREYFPPMPALQSPHLQQHPQLPGGSHPHHSMSVLTTGQLPPLPSPGGHQSRKHTRPKYGRQHTSSPTILHSHQSNSNDPKTQLNGTQVPAPSLPTPPAQNDHRPSLTPPNRATSPHAGGRPKRNKKQQSQQSQPARSINGEGPPPPKPASAGLLDGTVPPINVLIVEDNPINLRLLEAFMRRLQVRWKSAVNGREAVNVWRTGGFHLVLMDIQLPVMSGLEATKEIRRLESVNGIGLGVFGGARSESKANGDLGEGDKLGDMSLFKSPVIIVALTASSLQSDRHEALAAGCNDFLTKPVNYPWMERKVSEWGCMQALIDFDGWRKWKAYAAEKDAGLTEEQKKAKEKDEKAKQKAALKAMFARPPPSSSGGAKKKDDSPKDDKKENGSAKPTPNGGGSGHVKGHKRNSTGGGGASSAPVLETHQEEDAEDEK